MIQGNNPASWSMILSILRTPWRHVSHPRPKSEHNLRVKNKIKKKQWFDSHIHNYIKSSLRKKQLSMPKTRKTHCSRKRLALKSQPQIPPRESSFKNCLLCDDAAQHASSKLRTCTAGNPIIVSLTKLQRNPSYTLN